MTDPALDDLVTAALAQAPEIATLDGPRAEAWASDLLALAAELGDESGDGLVAALAHRGGGEASVALAAVAAFRPVETAPAAGRPPWADAIGTSVCLGAWLAQARGATSALFAFADAADVHHVVSVDLRAGSGGDPERVGEVAVGPGDLLDAVDEEDAAVDVAEAEPGELAARVAAALEATSHPTDSLVANGRLLAARLGPISGEAVTVPRPAVDVVPPAPERDTDDDQHARGLLTRALAAPADAPDPDALAGAAAALRSAMENEADDGAIAAWPAAAAAPPDMEADDLDLVLAALAAPVAPRDLAPLAPSDRDAVMALEQADWLGAVIGLVRQGPGAEVDGDALVDAVNRCPEVTSTIPKQDRTRIAWAFDRVIVMWDALGVVEGGRLSPLGAALLPAALQRAWTDQRPSSSAP